MTVSPELIPPPPRRRIGLILGLAAGMCLVLVLAAVSVVGVLLMSGDSGSRNNALPVVAAPPVGDLSNLLAFSDSRLREFAHRGAVNALSCTKDTRVYTGTTEVVRCKYAGDYSVIYVRYATVADRDAYAASARRGFRQETVTVDRDTTWTDGGIVQGAYVAGSRGERENRFIYWDSSVDAVSGELEAGTGRDDVAEAFWRQRL